jgi:hypothetical protein
MNPAWFRARVDGTRQERGVRFIMFVFVIAAAMVVGGVGPAQRTMPVAEKKVVPPDPREKEEVLVIKMRFLLHFGQERGVAEPSNGLVSF